MNSEDSDLAGRQWYVVHTKPRQELLVAALLEANAELAVYLPQVAQPRKAKASRTALFPGYLFVQADLSQAPASAIDKTPGVVRLVQFDGRPQPVPDATIDRLQERVAEWNRQGGLPQHPFQPGATVRFTDGPLRGLEGVFQGPMRPTERVHVLLSFLGSLNEVEVDAALLEPAGQRRPDRPPRRTRGKGRAIRPQSSRSGM